jgi:DNA-binding response OmpR family regulator
VINHKGLEINTASHKFFINGKEVQLTTKEYELLLFFASHPNIVFTKEHIINTIWGEEYYRDTATVPVHVQKIRKKIEKSFTHGMVTSTSKIIQAGVDSVPDLRD